MIEFDAIKLGARLKGLAPAGIAEIVSVLHFGADALNIVFRVGGKAAERLLFRGEETDLELLDAGQSYAFDADASREPPSAALIKQVEDGYAGRDTKDFSLAGAQSASGTKSRIIAGARAKIDKQRRHGRRHAGFNDRWDNLSKEEQMMLGANARNVWTISPRPYRGAHFATMPPELAERCIKAGCPDRGTVLDPFGGAGTTGLVAGRLGRHATLIELNQNYGALAGARIAADAPLLSETDT